MNKEETMKAVQAKHTLAKLLADEHHYQFVLMTCLVGSQNYGLETESSDIDTYSFVLPPYMDFISGAPMVSTTIEMEDGSHLNIKDIRLALNLLRKPSPNIVECFLSDYKVYEPEFYNVFKECDNNVMLYYLTHANYKNMVDAIVGTVYQLHGRNMTDGKKYAHALRLQHMLYRYLDPQASVSEYLHMREHDLKIARKAKIEYPNHEECRKQYEFIRQHLNNFGKEYQVSNAEKEVEYVAKYDINRLEYKIFDVYFSLNGLERKYDPEINF